MSTSKTPILPIVIVGKDRTRMSCAVIDHLIEHIKNATPYFICVSDRSKAGHDEAITNHLLACGVKDFEVLRTMPEENRYGWGAAINIGLECAFGKHDENENWRMFQPSALVVDNDWLLQRDLDIDKYLYALAFSDIGAITFKPIHNGTNVTLTDKILADGSHYLLRSKGVDSRFSFTAEIGTMLISRQMYEQYGKFKENCRTDETEWDFCNWYNSMSNEQRHIKRVCFVTDKDLYHEELNGKNHVFTHVGLHSQHDGSHK